MLLLIRKRVIAIFTTQNYRPKESSMAKLSMRSFAARHKLKFCVFEIGN